MPIFWLCMALGFGLFACGDSKGTGSSSSATPSAKAVAISGSARQFHVPSTSALPAFRDFDVAFFARAAAGEPNSPPALGGVALQNAAANCAESGCSFTARGVTLNSAEAGLMAQVAPHDAGSGWVATTSYVVNPNQVQTVARIGSSLSTFGPAFVLPQAAVDTWAQNFGVDSNALMTRGVCLGLLWSSKQADSASTLPGRAGARVSLAGGAGAALRYPNANYTALSGTSTNSDGAFVIAGPENPNAATSFEIPLTIQPTESTLRYITPKALVRPGWVTVVPILTQY